ncbi:hypothetical protein ABL78_7017 [Leptomonas seymouri]|uniref:Uncharacterized protein n=1 Tax=Leptomonas seymouri TaxID=5684 RepID=A0A0N0P3Q5_LEPSE|nr:hypothetical protein ABL78_7017 [Leptomonas seymouri]|eukprot:KPI83937.1 hypothetical protein ABL78_7017 [Leptomonas seymouri]
MWPLQPSTPRTVAKVLRRPYSGNSMSSAVTLPSLRCPSGDRQTFLTETDVTVARRPVLPPPTPRLQSAPGPRRAPSSAAPHTLMLPPSAPRCSSAKPHVAGRTRPGQHTRRPVDEALFCALRMEGEDTVAAQLRKLGPERLISSFRSLCSRLSMHHVTAAQFTFLCAAVLNTAVSQRDCEVVFAFLRTERGAGSLDVADLLLRLRTLFASPDILCALQLKRMLETNALNEYSVSMDELHKTFAGLHRLIEPGALKSQVSAQWESLEEELSRIQVQYAVLVSTFRVAARRLTPSVCAIVQSLEWDGTWKEAESEPLTSSPTCAPATPTPDVGRMLPFEVPPESQPAILSAVTKRYRQRLSEQDSASPAATPGQPSSGPGFTARRAVRHSTWRTSSSAVDPTNPHFIADVYATRRVVCSQE